MIEARNAKDVKDWLQGQSSSPLQAIILTQRAKGLLTGLINRYVGGNDNRYLVLGWLFNDKHNNAPIRSSLLTEGEWEALWEWAAPAKEESEWVVAAPFPLELALVLTEAIKKWEAVMMKAPIETRGDIVPGDLLRTAVFYEDGYITAMLDENGQPDVVGDDVRAFISQRPEVLGFLEKIRQRRKENQDE